MSSSVFPAVPQPKPVDVANDRLVDLEADLAALRSAVAAAKIAFDEGRFDEAVDVLEAARAAFDLLPARRAWAVSALTAAKEEAEAKRD